MHKRRRYCALGLVTLALAAPAALSHEGEHNTTEAFRARLDAPPMPVGSPDALLAAHLVTQLAAEISNRAHQPLLPKETQVDCVEWNDNVLEVDLTLPGLPPGWRLSQLDLESLTAAFHLPFIADPAFGGTRIRARVGADGAYDSLQQFVPIIPAPPEIATPDADAVAAAPADVPGGVAFGPFAAMRQPNGALSGVTVFISAGHGWTAGDTAWFLQRPVLQGMCEDYGNIDQLNVFAQYLFNAGATVVPFRPIGWQPIEIVLDNDDPGVAYTGSWSNSADAKYYENGVTNSGVPYRFATISASETATARYTPSITTSDYYPVYGFAIAGTNRAAQTYRIAHHGGVSAVVVDHRNVGNGWVWLGEYYFAAGENNYVEITNASPSGAVVIADAIRWGGGYGDVSRPGPDSVSGYPREEEGQRYWAHSELGNNGVGFDPSIWDPGGDDLSDNVGAGARFAREMNLVPAGGVQTDRWKRVHLEFHSNAFDTTARGQLCLITNTGATTNQTSFATILSNEIDADLPLLNSNFEAPWVDRSSPTLTGAYGAISTTNNSNEFDATLVELAFHDNTTDAALLRDPRMRAAMARACVHGIIRFLNTLPGSAVPLAFPPDTPRVVVVRDAGGGDIVLTWQPPLVDGARGDAATGYVVYQGPDGIGFGSPVVIGNALTATISGVALGETRYFRVAATNAAGESMPSETLAARRASSGTVGDVLVVNGFDRLRRQINPIQTFTQPPAYAGLQIERQMWRRSNSFDYIIEHAEALAANNVGFSSCTNEAVVNTRVALGDFDAVVWIAGNESTEDFVFSTTEQTRIMDYFNNHYGALFVSGADIAYALVNQNQGASFAFNTLRIGYSQNASNTFNVLPVAGRILDGVGPFHFDPNGGAAYRVASADVFTVGSGAQSCLTYFGGTGGVAGVQFTNGTFNVVTFGFPFETIGDEAARHAVMGRIIAFLRTPTGPPSPFDFDHDGDVDSVDFDAFAFCWAGPGTVYPPGNICRQLDADGDGDVDLRDFKDFQQAFSGP
ncbi:MAG: N-acetylmuramoyl-L-alanine amidase [Phycisphaerae bacterium]